MKEGTEIILLIFWSGICIIILIDMQRRGDGIW